MQPFVLKAGRATRRGFVVQGLALLLAASLLPLRASALELSAAEWRSIRELISLQLEALRAGDGARAFLFATPGIQARFRDGETFLAMVRDGYSALLLARYTEFLEGVIVEETVVQPLRLIAPDNTVLVALYTLEKQPDGRWRISGCEIRPSTVQAA